MAGGGVSGQPETPPGYATGQLQPRMILATRMRSLHHISHKHEAYD